MKLVFPPGVTPSWNTDFNVPETTVYVLSRAVEHVADHALFEVLGRRRSGRSRESQRTASHRRGGSAAATRARPRTDLIMVSPF